MLNPSRSQVLDKIVIDLGIEVPCSEVLDKIAITWVLNLSRSKVLDKIEIDMGIELPCSQVLDEIEITWVLSLSVKCWTKLQSTWVLKSLASESWTDLRRNGY